MNNKEIIHGVYADEEVLMNSISELKAKGIKINNVFSPFPIHGIDKLLGIRPTRLSVAAFIYGCTGITLALLMMWYMMISDWPMIIGGKPNFTLLQNLPSFIPITFEITVLCAAHGMFITFLLASWLLPGVKATNPHPKSTDDKMILEAESGTISAGDIASLMKQTGAESIL
jgi:hypothetical protein